MNYRKQSLMVWCSLWSAVCLAADPAAPPPAPTNAPAPAATPAAPATAAAAPAKPADTAIRFQFDGLPYAEVITRFAQMVNKPLIADSKVEGTLTFSDPRPYNYPEALDTLNLILSLKGVMLVESDRYLRLVPFKELPQMPLKIFHGLEHTGDAQPGEVVTVVLPLQHLDATELTQSATAMLSSAGSIAPLSRGRGLIVTDRLANIKRIRDLLTEVDTASPVERKMKSYNLLHASGMVLTDMINRTFGAASAPRRIELNPQTKQYQQLPPDPNDYITAVYDEGSRVMVMFGPTDRMTLAESLIKEFEEKNGAPHEVKTFFPQSLSAHDLAKMIRAAMPSVAGEAEPAATAAMKARLVVDAAVNRLIVAAPTANQLTEIEAVIKTLDVRAATGTNTNTIPDAPGIRLYRAKVIDSESLAKILTDAMTKPGFRPPNERPFKATLEPGTRSIVMTGPAEEVEYALSLARQLDTALPVARHMKFLPLKSGRASDFLTRLKPLYQDQARNLPGPPGPEGLLVPDDFNNRLIVSGTEEEVKLVQELVDQLDVAPDDNERQLKTVALKYASANWITTALQQLYSRQFMSESPRRRVIVTPATDDRTLFIQAPRTLFPRIDETLAALDVEPARGVFEVRTYQLTGVNATDLMATLNRLFADRQDWQKKPVGVPVLPARFEADPTSNTLIVIAAREQLDQIDQMIVELKASVEIAVEVRVFRLKYLDPASMVTLLDTLMHEQAPVLQGKFRASPFGVPVADYGKFRIAAAPILDAVVIQGPPDKLKQAEGIIKELDVEKADPVASIRAVPLKYASAAWLTSIVQQLYGRQFQTDNPRTRVALTASTDDRTLIVQAPPGILSRLVETVQTLDVEPARGVFEVRTYQLTGANASDLVATLTRLFSDRQDWQKKTAGVPVSQPRFEADATSNTLIVAATREQFEQIDALIKEIRASVEVSTEVKVFRLKYLDPNSMVTLLDTLMHEQAPVLQGKFRASPYGVPVADYGKFRIAAAPVLDAVVIQGPPDKLKQAEEIIKELDVEKADPVASIRAIPLKYASANWLSTILQQLYGRQFQTDNPRTRVAMTPSADDRTLVVQAPPAILGRLAETIQTLDVEPVRGVFEVRTYQLNGANATDLVTTLTRLFADRQDWQKKTAGVPLSQPRFEADPASNSLIVAATREQFEQIDQLIKELRASVEVATEIKVFRLKYCDPEQMVSLLDTMLHEQAPVIQAKSRVTATTNGPIADYGKLRIAAAPVLDAVVVQGPPDKLRLAEELITSLDKEKTDSNAAIRTVHLAKARAEAVAEAVNKTLDTRSPRNSTRRTIVTAVTASNSLLLDGPPAEVEEIMKTVHDLDQESTDGNIEFHIYRLENGNAKEVMRILNQMIDSLAKSDTRFGRAYKEVPITMAIDDRSNSLIISASPAAFKVVERLLLALDAAPRHTDRAMNLYTLVNADPFELAVKLQALYAERPKDEQIVADGDYFSSSISVIARPQDFPQIEEQIRRLDEAAVDNSLQVRMIPVEKMPAAQMAEMLTNIYAQMSAGDVRIVERLPPRPRDTNTVQAIPISRPPSATNSVPLTNAPAESTLTRTNLAEAASPTATNTPAHRFFPEVVVAVDKAANALLLSGPARELDRIQTIVRDLTRAAANNNTELRIFPLTDADPIVVARTLTELFRTDVTGLQGQGGNPNRPRRNNPAQFGPMVGPRVIVVAEARSRSIIVRAQPTDFMLIESLLKQLDVAGANAQIGFRLVSLENSQADKLLPLVTQMLAELRLARPGEPVMVTRDLRGNALFIVARNNILDQVESMIQKLDTPAAYAEAEVAIVPLKNGNAAQLAGVLMALFRPGNQGELTLEARELQEQVRRLKLHNAQDEVITLDLTKPIKIMADPIQGAQGGGNRLILVSTPDNLKALAAVVATMDTVPSMANIRVFPLQFANAATVQRLLLELYQGPNAARLPPEDRPNVSVDPRTEALIVSGNEAAFSVVTNLLVQLDVAGTNAQIGVRLVNLENSQADKLLPLVTQMLAELRIARPGEPVMVTRGQRANALFIVARNNLLDQLESMIQKLDTPASNVEVEVAIIPLKNGNAPQLVGVLQALLRPGTQGELTTEAHDLQEQVRRLKLRNAQDEPITLDLTKPLKILADPITGVQGGGNRIILVSTPDNLKALTSVVAMMDTVPAMANIRIFPLQFADAATVQRLLTELYQGPSAARLPPEDRPNVAIDPRTDALIVSGNETAFSVVTNLLHQLDREGDSFTGQVRLVALRHARASQLSTVLEQFFRGKQAAETARSPGARSIPLTVVPDDRSNTLLITGSREGFAAIERMITQLDVEQIIARTSFKAITLKHATASKLQATLNQLFLRRPPTIRGEAPEPITIVEDSWANALVIGASPEDMLMVESLITQLDNETTDNGVEVQVFPLTKADARQVAQTITTLYRTGGPGTPSVVTANVDERLNAVIVSAGGNDIKRIGDLIKKLDTDQVTQVHQVRIFTLTNARAIQLAAILTSVLNTKPTPLTDQSPSRQALLEFISRNPDGKELMTSALKEGIIIAPDPRVNALVVSAPLEYMKFLERLIADLDSLSPQQATIKVFPLKNADARQMMTVLTALFHLQAVPQATTNPRTIQYNLVRPPTSEQPEPTEGDNGGVIGSAEENALTVTVDLRSNSLLVGGAERYVNLAASIIETLDSSPAQERKAEVYRLKNARSTDIQNALANFLKQDTQLLISAVGQQALAQEILDRNATIVAETNSNTLLISATPRFFKELHELVEQLDQPLRQVLIQVLLAEVTLTKGDELGVEWTYQTTGTTSSKTGTDFGLANALKTSGGFGSAVSGDSFNFLFRALQTEDRLHVLSRPQILTADNQLATIKVGQKVPLVTGSQVIGLTGGTANTFTYQDVGVDLTVTPRISPDGFVKMDVSPTITQLSASTTSVGTGINAPIINQRLATTSVSVQSGQSIMIGGLISSSDDLNVKRFPILGSIPWIGNAFTSKVRNTTRTELLIVLTPQVLINGTALATTNTTLNVTRDQLDRATFKGDLKNGSLEQQMLEPVYPGIKTNGVIIVTPLDRPTPKK